MDICDKIDKAYTGKKFGKEYDRFIKQYRGHKEFNEDDQKNFDAYLEKEKLRKKRLHNNFAKVKQSKKQEPKFDSTQQYKAVFNKKISWVTKSM